jgi:hypothetical protein
VTDETACLVMKEDHLTVLSDLVDLVQNRPDDALLLDFFQSLSLEEAEKVPQVATIVNSIHQAMSALFDKSFVAEYVSAFHLNGFSVDGGCMGLFLLASKAAHSCSPNVIQEPYGKDRLKLIAIKPIKTGELIEMAYIAGEKLAWPRRLRQKKLLNDRGFICLCQRCRDVDDVRALKCLCKGDVFESFRLKGQYTCNSCNTTFSATDLPLETERKLEDDVMRLEANIMGASPQKVLSILSQAQKDLGANHWTIFFMECMYLEMAMQGLVSINQQMANNIVFWLDAVLFKVNPVSCASILNKFLKSGILNIGVPKVKKILIKIDPFFRMQCGKDDPDVLYWARLLSIKDNDDFDDDAK